MKVAELLEEGLCIGRPGAVGIGDYNMAGEKKKKINEMPKARGWVNGPPPHLAWHF